MNGPATADRGRPPLTSLLSGVAVAVVLGAIAGAISLLSPPAPGSPGGRPSHPASPSNRSPVPASAPRTATTTTPALPPPGSGFVAGKVTAVGDSVMLDYQDPLQADIRGIDVQAAVSRQWSAGESVITSLKSEGALGGVVIVGLGTNGPITDADVDAMMSQLGGASRVLFVNVHVDRPWQDPNNAVLARGAARYRNVRLVDWASLAAQNPQWFGADGTHLPIDGPGAGALAFLVAATLAGR